MRTFMARKHEGEIRGIILSFNGTRQGYLLKTNHDQSMLGQYGSNWSSEYAHSASIEDLDTEALKVLEKVRNDSSSSEETKEFIDQILSLDDLVLIRDGSKCSVAGYIFDLQDVKSGSRILDDRVTLIFDSDSISFLSNEEISNELRNVYLGLSQKLDEV